MRKSRPVQVKHIQIGGGAPVVIQSMTKTDTSDVGATVAQIEERMRAGCEIVQQLGLTVLLLLIGLAFWNDLDLPRHWARLLDWLSNT